MGSGGGSELLENTSDGQGQPSSTSWPGLPLDVRLASPGEVSQEHVLVQTQGWLHARASRSDWQKRPRAPATVQPQPAPGRPTLCPSGEP